MKVNEVFYSLSGEGVHAGIPTVFIRLQGCNLRCSYCDTGYALDPTGGEEMTQDEVLSRIAGWILGRWVLITGGEPLLQGDEVGVLVNRLQFRGRSVEVETNGSIDPPNWARLVDSWSVDVKCPSSGPAYGVFRAEWLRKLRKQDQLKFVVGTQEDLDFVVSGFLGGTKLRPVILISPVTGVLLDKKQGTVEEYWNREWLQKCAEFCKEQNVRMSLQLHKLIWGDKKGV